MLMILFYVADQTFALDCRYVLEIIPMIKIQRVPNVSSHMAGMANFDGHPVTMYDFTSMIAGRPSANLLTTRILMLTQDADPQSQSRFLSPIGLIVERAIEVAEIDLSELTHLDLNINAFNFFSGVATLKGRTIQIIDVPMLISSLQVKRHADRS